MHNSLDLDTFRYRQVERHILELIESGRITPGGRVPSLRKLSGAMGVGVATVNHAYAELERKGVIEARPRSGYFLSNDYKLLPLPRPKRAMPSGPIKINRSRLIGTVLQTVGAGDLLPFGVVCPDPSLMPVKTLARLISQVCRANPGRAAGYEIIPGNPELRRELARLGREWCGPLEPEDLIITSGAMEGLYISLRCLTRPGDTVLVQSPTYYCFLQLLETLGLKVIELSSCPELGVSPADVRQVLDGFNVKACILSPNFNNPDASLVPDEVKAEIMDMLAERDIPLVEDDVSGDLHFGETRPGTFKKLDRKGLVLYCSSFSKTIAPGYRIGWTAPGRFLEKALEIKATTNVSTASPVQMAAAEYLRSGAYPRQLEKLRSHVQNMMETFRHHISTHFPAGTGLTRPSGGLVLWLELPKPADSVEIFFRAREAGIGVAPGAIFTTRDKFNNFIRMSCGVVWRREIMNGIETLGRIARECAG